jgi:hypothetical protein
VHNLISVKTETKLSSATMKLAWMIGLALATWINDGMVDIT